MQINIVIAAPRQNESGRVCSYAITPRAAAHQGGLAFWRFNIFICLQSGVKGEICSISVFNAGVKLFEGLRTNGPPRRLVLKGPEVAATAGFCYQPGGLANTLTGII